MRDIKFRVWSKESKKMYLPKKGCDFLVRIDGEYFVDEDIVENVGLIPVKKDDYVLMQYTGLKDKNRKEIYEGDIVNLGGDGSILDKEGNWWGASGPAGYSSPVQVVMWDEEQTGFDPFANYDCDCGVYMEASKCEVVGNIYENPNLLKEEK